MNIHSLMFTLDANHDGHYSLWEFWDVCRAIYWLPGNLVVEGLGHIPWLASMLNIHASQATGYGSLNGTLAVVLSLAFWVSVLFTVLTVASPTDTQALDDLAGANVHDTAFPGGSSGLGPQGGIATHQHVLLAGNRKGLSAKAAAVSHTRMHPPVSRSYYALPGKTPARKRHRMRLAH
jgi:hypothetical protein